MNCDVSRCPKVTDILYAGVWWREDIKCGGCVCYCMSEYSQCVRWCFTFFSWVSLHDRARIVGKFLSSHCTIISSKEYTGHSLQSDKHLTTFRLISTDICVWTQIQFLEKKQIKAKSSSDDGFWDISCYKRATNKNQNASDTKILVSCLQILDLFICL